MTIHLSAKRCLHFLCILFLASFSQITLSSESASNHVSVTFQVDMSAVDTHAEGVYLAGGSVFGQDGLLMTDNGSDVWSVSVEVEPNAQYMYKFRNQPSYGTWDGFEDATGLAAEGCSTGAYNDRFVDVGGTDITLPVVAYGSCTTDPYVSTEPALSFTVTAEGASEVKFHSSHFGWDVGAQVVAADNGDGTWTVTVDPGFGANVEYKWIVDGTEEDLSTAFRNGECDGDNVAAYNDTWFNRTWAAGSGNVTGDIAGACSGTDSSGGTDPADVIALTTGDVIDFESFINIESLGGTESFIENGNLTVRKYPWSDPWGLALVAPGEYIYPLSNENSTISANVYSDNPEEINLILHYNPWDGNMAESRVAHSGNGWEVLVWDFSDTDAVHFPDFNVLGFMPAPNGVDQDSIFKIDDIVFGSESNPDPVTPSNYVDFSEAFGGMTISEGSVYTYPSGAESWGGFANMNTDMYPLIFPEAGSITFNGSVADGGSADLRFRLEFRNYPDVDPAYDTATVTVSGATPTSYTIAIPSQGANTFSSLIMYLETMDVAVTITDVVVSTDANNNDATGQNNQIIKVANNPKGILGKTAVLDIAYDTSDNNNQLTGLGMRVHFNSSLLSFKEITNLVEQDIIVNGQGPFNDEDDFDNDPLTDQYISFGWASLFGNWPNMELPAVLMNIAFDISDAIDTDITSETSINFTSSALASGYQFESESYNLELQAASWDFDGNGQADALSDGLMMLRYCFGLRGEYVTSMAMSVDSPMNSDEVITEIETALAIADIDNDGEIGALTDGLMLLRYLFGLEGEMITNQAVGPSASRGSHEEIQAYLEAYMPAM